MNARWPFVRWAGIGTLLSTLAISLLFNAQALDEQRLEANMRTRFGAQGLEQLKAWETLLIKSQSLSELEKVQQVNNFFNQHVRYVEDIDNWKQSDYWATPLETLGTGAGDCEDYAIAKYLTLLQLGVTQNHLRLIYVKAQIGGPMSRIYQAHMVLGYYEQPSAIPLILDSLVSDIEKADMRTDLHPVFSFNSEGLWVGNQPQPNIDPTARLSRWRDLLERVKHEGF